MIVVTGGAGFIGSHVVEALVERGERVRVLDDFSTGHRENLAAVEGRVEVVAGSVTSPGAVERALRGARGVFHLAADPSVARSLEEPLAVHAVNATGTLTVLEGAREAGVERLVFASSSAVYGENGGKPGAEEDCPDPRSPYAAQKLLGEHYCRIYALTRGLRTVILRYYNVFGPRQDPGSPYSGVISVFCDRLLGGATPEIHGDGGQTRDFIFVDDVARANLKAMELPLETTETFNIATGASIPLMQLYEGLCRTLGLERRPAHGPVRAGDIRHSRADVSRAARLLEFSPRVELEAGLARTLEWYRNARGS